MTPKRRWTRRRFLRSTAIGGGVLALGFYIAPVVRRRRQQDAIRDIAEKTGDFRPNAWLVIQPDNTVIFVLDRVEMGQGTMTSHPMLIAEELQVNPALIVVEFADADRRFDHPEFFLQLTGGSSSVRTSWEVLRYAGAVAREMLRAAGAQQWNAPLEECLAEKGQIVHTPTGRTKTYGSLALLATQMPIPDPPLKESADFSLIGTSIDRLDAPMKVDGSAKFGIDVDIPGMATAIVMRPAAVGAEVKLFDATRALSRPGVQTVINIPSGVAIVAESYWKARSAVDDVTIEWEGGRIPLSTSQITEELAQLTSKPGRVIRDDGDAETTLTEATKIIDAAYEVPHLAHATMEPMNCTALVKGDQCEIWAPTQTPGVAREAVAEALEIPRENVVVHTTFLGGGFGRRLVADFVVEAAHISKRINQPVKVVWSREDDMCHSMYRPHVRHVLRAAVNDTGQPTAWRHRVASPSLLKAILPQWLPAITPDAFPPPINRQLIARGALTNDWMADPTSTEGASDTPYAVDNLRVELALHDPGVPIGFWRSVGHSHTAFAVESFVDELARGVGQDPYHFRRHLLRNSPRHLAVLDAAAERAGWDNASAAGLFRGIAQHYSFETYVAQVAELSIEEGRIRIHRVICAVDCGHVINPDIVRAQMEGGIVFGLSAALKQRISYVNGHVEQTNFDSYGMLRMREMPVIDVVIVPSTDEPTGVGEPGVPPIAPAVANALAAATGRRIRKLPIETEWNRKL